MNTTRSTLAAVSLIVLFAACRSEADPMGFALAADRFAGSEWSEPVNLGPVVNSGFVDANASLSPNGHALYFISTRPGGFGNNDIWMSERQCLACPWEAPVNLGAVINTDAIEASPSVSEDGQLLFFYSTKAGGFGSADIYVSHRISTSAAGDVWGEPVNLGPDVNTVAAEQGRHYVKITGEANASVYFNRAGSGNTDIYKVFISNDGVPLGPAVLVPELSDPSGFDQKVSVRTDGHELFLSAIRTGGFGNFDIYRFTRQSSSDPWSAPEHLDAPINTPDVDSQPNLSRDGRTMIFTSIRTGGLGLQDLWMTTRRPGVQP